MAENIIAMLDTLRAARGADYVNGFREAIEILAPAVARVAETENE